MKKLLFKSLVPSLLGCALAFSAHAQTTFSDNFGTAVNYVTNGVAGTIWDGIYLGANEFSGGNVAGGPGSTLVADANLTAANILNIQTTQTDWEGGGDDGFFLFKKISGDFTA